MLPLTPYNKKKSSEIFKECIEIRRYNNTQEYGDGNARKAELLDNIDAVEDAELVYKKRGVKGLLHTISPYCGDERTKKNINSVYEKRFVDSEEKYHKFYNEIMKLAPWRTCPFCGLNTVMNIDHYLPKAHFPFLSVAPINLLPCCSDCNKHKGEHYPKSHDEQILHPYFDNLENIVWLAATVNENYPVTLNYFVDCDDPKLNMRIKFHFDKLRLNALYQSQSGQELISRKSSFNNENLSKEDRKNILIEQADILEDCNKNSYNAVMWRVLSKNEWFIIEGYRLLG